MLHFNRLLRNRHLQKKLNIILNSARSNSSSIAEFGEVKIEIPNKIKRSPTDLLYALSSTVGTDPTAAHYKYHDDPYLIPLSNIGKRTFALAQESGRKAARWVRDENSKLFQHKVADPPIAAYTPKMVFTEESEVDEDCLQGLVRNVEVADAVLVYNIMQTKNLPISDDLKEELLELLCFYNHDSQLDPEYIEERWFSQATVGKERQRKTWKDGELAEKLFNEIEPKNSQTYAAIIRGMCKYFQAERAWALFQEALDKNIAMDTKTYNSIISVASFLKESGEMRWDLCRQLLTEMNEKNLVPNLGTMNSLMSVISTINNYRLAKSATLQVLSEFRNLGIEPSLGTWYYVIISFCRERGPVSHVLVDIMNQIDDKEFKIEDPKDTFFFVTAMDVCRHHLHDKTLAKQVNKLLHYGNNYDLIGDSFKESIYYRNYFALLCQTEPLEEFMNVYDCLVPNVYIPEPGIMEEILKAVETSGALELIPKMWSDMVIFDHTNRESLLVKILNIMVENKPSNAITAHEGLNKKFANIARDIYTKIDELRTDRNTKLSFTGAMLGDILTLLARNNRIDDSILIFSRLEQHQQSIPGNPSPESIAEFVELCIIEKRPSRAFSALQYCAENGFPNCKDIARRVVSAFTLDDFTISKIRSFVGEDVFLDKPKEPIVLKE